VHGVDSFGNDIGGLEAIAEVSVSNSITRWTALVDDTYVPQSAMGKAIDYGLCQGSDDKYSAQGEKGKSQASGLMPPYVLGRYSQCYCFSVEPRIHCHAATI
jgi:hypothetical protein